MIQARHITKMYREQPVLENASLTVNPGQCLVLGGDNGSGKTTLLHILMGLRRPDAGQVIWRGQALTGASPRAWRQARRRWGFLPQHPVFPAGASVEAILKFHARIRNTPLEPAHEWLGRVGLESSRRKRIEALSGGMRQRLGIALVMFFNPQLIVMDEPASSLDPSWRSALAQWTRQQAAGGAAVLVTSQLLDSWGHSSDRLYCENGHVGPVPADTFAAEPS